MTDTPPGSSPLTRGKPCARATQGPSLGLIPAHAGKTDRSESEGLAGEAHPRSRGENPFLVAVSFLEDGSSPLTRGKLDLADSDAQMRGLIPAHAGKTARASP